MTKHAHTVDGQLCLRSHYASVVEAHKEVEVYQLGDVDCSSCLRRMAEKHEALAAVFRARLAALAPHRCRVYDTSSHQPGATANDAATPVARAIRTAGRRCRDREEDSQDGSREDPSHVTQHTARLGGRRIVIEGYGRKAPALVAIVGGGETPIIAWLSPRALRRLVVAAQRILK